METIEKKQTEVAPKQYNGCLDLLLTLWIIGGIITIIWNVYVIFSSLFGENKDYNCALAVSLLEITDIVLLFGLIKLKQFKKIGFYLTIIACLAGILVSIIYPEYILQANPLSRNLVGMLLIILLFFLRQDGKSGYQTIGLQKDSNKKDTNSSKIEEEKDYNSEEESSENTAQPIDNDRADISLEKQDEKSSEEEMNDVKSSTGNLQDEKATDSLTVNDDNEEVQKKSGTNEETKDFQFALWGLLFILIFVCGVSLYYFFGNNGDKETLEEKMNRAINLYNEDKNEEAFLLFESLAKEDYTPGLNAYGFMLLEGEGTQKNVLKGIQYLDSAANRNHINALKNLGEYYYDEGKWEKALEYYKRLEQLGETDIFHIVGYIYLDGLKNVDEAIKYGKKAIETGDKDACFLLGNTYIDTTKKEYDLAFYWYERGTKEGSQFIQAACWCNIGWLYIYGKGTSINYEKAFEAYQKSLSLDPDNSYSLYHIGWMYYYGKYVKKDKEKALSYLKKSSDLGNELAQELYAKILREE